MTPETLEALKASIAKWERNTKAKHPDDFKIARHDCALCDMFWFGQCEGCPVSYNTGATRCYGTPYEAAANARDEWDDAEFDDDSVERRKARAAARKEVAFLKSLLPPEEQVP